MSDYPDYNKPIPPTPPLVKSPLTTEPPKLKEVGRYSLTEQYGNKVVIEYEDEQGNLYRRLKGDNE